jgi:hypothetical protein
MIKNIQVLEWLAFLVTVHSPWSNGVKIDGTKLTEPNTAKSVGPEPNLNGTIYYEPILQNNT